MISYLITADPGVALDPADVKSRPAKQRRICSAGLIYCDQPRVRRPSEPR